MYVELTIYCIFYFLNAVGMLKNKDIPLGGYIIV